LRNPFILAVILFLAGNYLLAAEKGSVGTNPRFRVFALKHISAEQAKSLLAKAKLGTVSQLPTANMILVTGQPRQLIKANAVLKLFDAETPVVMKAILPASAAGSLPSNEQIAAEIGNMSIGSFSNPPSGVGKAKAIIDVHDDSVVAIAPADQLDKIIEAIGRSDSNGSIKQLQKGKYEALEPAQPKIDPVAEAEIERVKAEFQKIKAELNGRNGSSESKQTDTNANKTEPNELFDKLLDSLDEAEKKVAELARPAPTGPEPNKPPIQPGTVITPPEKKAPNEPSVVLEQPKEKVIEAAKEAEKPDLASVPEKAVAEKIDSKLPSKTDPNTVAVEIEEPNQIAPIKLEEPNTVTQAVEPNTATKVIKPTAAKGPYQPDLAKMGDEELTLDMPPKINIIDLLDLVGKYMDLDYMYDPVDITGLKGEVTLVLQGPIKIKDLYPLAESVLRFRGYVMTRRGNLITIVPIAKVASIDAPIVDPDKPGIQTGDVIITRIFELEHIDTTSAQNLLTAMKLGVTTSPIPDMGTIIITGYAYRMERIEALLEMIDKPGEKKQFRSRTLQYTMAQTLTAKVKTLAEQLGTVSITVAVPTRPTTPTRPATPGRRPTPTRPTPTRPTTPAATPAKPTVYLDADERTNRILMIGLEEQLTVVDTLIDALDVEQQILRTLRLYEIQYVDAEEVRTKLSELGIISAGRTPTASSRTTTRTTPTSRTTPGRPTPTRPSTPTATGTIQEPLTEEPQVVIIESTNSLLVNATAEQHVQIATIIGYVDSEQEVGRQNPYVIYPLENQEPDELAGVLEKLISDTITEQSGTASKLVKTTQKKKKIEDDIFIVPDPKSYSLIVYASKKNQQWLASLIEELDEYRPQVLLDVTLVEISKNDQFSLDLDLVSKFPKIPSGGGMDFFTSLMDPSLDKHIVETVSTSGAGSGFYADEHIQVLLTAMQTKDYGRVLARPKLLVNDNEEGIIKAETITTVVSPKSQVVPGSSSTVSTSATSVELSTYTEGITLTITPHISKGDQLRLNVSVTRTDFGLRPDYSLTTPEGNLTGPTPPDLLTSDVTSTVTVPDRHTIILGGLEKLKQTKGGTKVPFIGDIPIIGGLFRSTANKDTQTRLYVFVKANILRPGEESAGISDLEKVSLKNRATFEKYEKEMQEYEDWPGIKPEPMDPLQVLEADEAFSLRDRQVFDKRKKETQEHKGISGTRPELMHPIQILKTD
jgi:type II secretory pathway component GspD/PulD (secretin)